jgi:uncharacterized protein
MKALVACGCLAALLSAPCVAQVRFANEAGGLAGIAVTSYRDIPFRTVVRQQHDYSCGSAALATLLTFHYGRARSETDVFRAMYEAGDKKRIEAQGFSLLEMKRYLDGEGLPSGGFRMTYERMADLNKPVIVMIDSGKYRHFVVVKGITANSILIGDPALGLHTYRRKDFEKVWNGIAFMVRDSRSESVFNAREEWRPYAPTPWTEAYAAGQIDVAREIAPLYQISPVGLSPAAAQ